MSVLIMFRSLTYAQKGARALERQGVDHGRVMRSMTDGSYREVEP